MYLNSDVITKEGLMNKKLKLRKLLFTSYFIVNNLQISCVLF